jgi:putative inorganic carbon (HCO3(-)) transporter
LNLSLKKYLIFVVSIIFLAVNLYLMTKDKYFGFIIPAAWLVLWSAIYAYDKLWLFAAFFVPLSVNFETPIGALFVPTEPIIFGLMFIFFLKEALDRNIDKKILKHPISILIYIYLSWMLITTITSTLPLVSAKFMITKLWFISVFYFMGISIFKFHKNIYRFLYLMIISMAIAVVYTLVIHANNGFSSEAAHWVMFPFFKDHTVYGAVLSMFIPIGVAFLFLKNVSKLQKGIIIIINVLFIVGIIFSYTRAAWLSLIMAIGILILVLLKINFKTVGLALASITLIFFMYQDQIIYSLSKNTQDSSENFMENIQSMTNISSDASNLERLNRWNSAIKMYKEKPLIGFGPGTYQFQYGVFQKYAETTIISTNDGSMGNAHSEYLGPLAEQGLPGMLFFIFIVIGFSIFALNLHRNMPKGDMKVIVLASYLGLFTYFTHGILNNYLDTDKASVPFWGFMAIIVSIGIYHQNSGNLKLGFTENKE